MACITASGPNFCNKSVRCLKMRLVMAPAAGLSKRPSVTVCSALSLASASFLALALAAFSALIVSGCLYVPPPGLLPPAQP